MLIYCKRWKLLYWRYMLTHGWAEVWHKADGTEYTYDAFVAFEVSDMRWIANKLMDELEKKRSFKLCVHHRDFPGGVILEQIIVDSIQKIKP